MNLVQTSKLKESDDENNPLSYEGVFSTDGEGKLEFKLDKGNDDQMRFSGIEIFSRMPDNVPEQLPLAAGF